MKLVTIDPRRIELADYGVLHLSPRPGTNAARHARARARRRRATGCVDHDFLDARTEGYEDASQELLADYTPEDVERITGVPAADLERAAHIYARGRRTPASRGASA